MSGKELTNWRLISPAPRRLSDKEQAHWRQTAPAPRQTLDETPEQGQNSGEKSLD